jgi:hypothetical protein
MHSDMVKGPAGVPATATAVVASATVTAEGAQRCCHVPPATRPALPSFQSQRCPQSGYAAAPRCLPKKSLSRPSATSACSLEVGKCISARQREGVAEEIVSGVHGVGAKVGGGLLGWGHDTAHWLPGKSMFLCTIQQDHMGPTRVRSATRLTNGSVPSAPERCAVRAGPRRPPGVHLTHPGNPPVAPAADSPRGPLLPPAAR